MKRVLIIGNNASGKTTMAKILAEKLNLPLVHLDRLYWRDNWEHATNEEFDRLLKNELEKSEWIIDGNIKRTLPTRLKYCDTVIYLDFPSWFCVLNAIRRLIQNYGKSRSDVGGNCEEKLDWNAFQFIHSIWQFNRKNRQNFYDLLEQAKNVKVIFLKNRKQVKKFLNEV